MTGIDVRVRIVAGPDANLASWAWQKATDSQLPRNRKIGAAYWNKRHAVKGQKHPFVVLQGGRAGHGTQKALKAAQLLPGHLLSS